MTQIPFEHEGCDGWGVYESQFIDAEDAKNMHVAEGKITVNAEGKKVFRVNQQHKTICGEVVLVPGKRITAFQEAPKMRTKLAEIQNQGKEVCGTCVSRFYADPEP